MAYTPSRSYFWSCLNLDEECPLFNTADPLLYYFGLSMIGIYFMFFVVVMSDMSFWWALDNGECDIGRYANAVKQKVSEVEAKQYKLLNTPTLAEKLLTKSRESEAVVRALRTALTRNDDGQYFKQLISSSAPSNLQSDLLENKTKTNPAATAPLSKTVC